MTRQGVKHLGIFICLALLMVIKTSWSDSRADIPSMEMERYNMEPIEQTPLGEVVERLVRVEQDTIVDSADMLVPLIRKLISVRSGADSVVSILHIGDSHVQAGYWTARIRELLQRSFGNAGRGLVLPYKLVDENEPPSYSIVTSKPYLYNKATLNRRDEPLSFSGIGITFEQQGVEFGVGARERFNSITIFHSPTAPTLSYVDSLAMGTNCTIDNTTTSTRVIFNQSVDSLVLKGSSQVTDDPTYYGFSLENGQAGVLYHDIGANGAAFEHFAKNSTILTGGAKELRPDLIIVSLGTNNSYGSNFSKEYLHGVISRFVVQIKENYPESAILITTPRESCKRSSRRIYRPNKNIEETANTIIEVARQSGIAYWDLYRVAGGAGVSEEWFKQGLASRDRIHMTKNGYVAMGDLLYNALASYYNGWIEANQTIE